MKREQSLISVILALSISLALILALLLHERSVQAKGSVLSAQELQITDKQGRTRIRLSSATIEILDPNGKIIWRAPPFDWSEDSTALEPYTRIGGNHWVQTVLDDGRLVVLEDGSRWEIRPIHQTQTVLWAPTSPITVEKADSPNEDFRYILTNSEEEESVPARYRGRP